jgi:hypothetical protein
MNLTMFELYKYQPLSSPRAIRVVELLPALRFSAQLCCSLVETSLDVAEPFDALSYVWGYPKGDKPLQCQGQTILITENCELALRHIRHRKRKIRLWVDAVCINQNSVPERNQQVSIMGEIYQMATCVTVWLGEGNSNLRNAFGRYYARERGMCIMYYYRVEMDFPE